MSFEPPHRTYHPSEFDGLTCKILFNKNSVLQDVLEWYDKEYLDGLE